MKKHFKFLVLAIALLSVFIAEKATASVPPKQNDNWVYELKKPTIDPAYHYWTSPFDGTLNVLFTNGSVPYDRTLNVIIRTSNSGLGGYRTRAFQRTVPAGWADIVLSFEGWNASNMTVYSISPMYL